MLIYHFRLTPQAHIRRTTGLPGLRQDAAAHTQPEALYLPPSDLPMNSFPDMMPSLKETEEAQFSFPLSSCVSMFVLATFLTVL